MNKVGNHLRELLDAGSIEIAETKRHRNFDQYVYRAVETPFYSDEDIAGMTPGQRQVVYGLVIQQLCTQERRSTHLSCGK